MALIPKKLFGWLGAKVRLDPLLAIHLLRHPAFFNLLIALGILLSLGMMMIVGFGLTLLGIVLLRMIMSV